MKKHPLNKIKDELQKLVISDEVTEAQAEASMRILQEFNQSVMGLSHFSGTTPWERHMDDEFLQVLEGEVDVILFGHPAGKNETLEIGDCFVVPRGLWHRQSSKDGAKVMFITSAEGNETSTEETPQG